MLSNLLRIEKGDIISIVGSGGKTSAMILLSKELKDYKRLITTTTKIFMPEKEDFDYSATGFKEAENLSANENNKGIYLIGKKINKEDKLISFPICELKKFISYYDVVIIESDGSKMKLLKGWNEREPVVIEDTTKTLGIINLRLLGQEATSEKIHRVREYLEISQGKAGEYITLEHIKNTVINKKGLFKNSYGQKILLINMIEGTEDEEAALKLLNLFKNEELKTLDKIIIGSIKKNSFKMIY